MFARWLSVLLVATTFVLVLLGGVVHTEGASLACPDWPLCYGMIMPPMQGDIALEHGHRLLASVVGAMSVVLAIALTNSGDPQRRALRPLAWAGVALVLLQGTLGGLTVLLRLPPPVSIAHWGTSMVFLAWATWMAVRLLSPAQGPSMPASLRAQRPRVLWAAGLVYAQGMLGSAVRHTHASLSCGPQALFCNDGFWPHNGPQWLQTSHRLTALLALLVVGYGLVPVMRAARAAGERFVRRAAIVVHATLALQILVGVLTVRSGVQIHSVTTHVALAAVLWGTLVATAATMTPQAPSRQAAAAGAPPWPSPPRRAT